MPTDLPRRRDLVLVVDDERGIRAALEVVLEEQYAVVTAASGEAGLEILRQGGVSVVVLDLRMPGWGGIETLLRMRDVDSDVGVVIITAYGSRDDAVKALRLDTYELVAKPFQSADVIAAVGRAAEAARDRRRHSRSHRRRVSPAMRRLCDADAVEPRPNAYREFGAPRAPAVRPTSEDGELGLLWAVFDDGIQTYCRELQNGTTSSLDYREVEWWIFHSRGDALTSFGNLCELFAIDPRRMRGALAALRHRPDAEIMRRLVRSA